MASPLRPGGGVLSGATSQEEYLCARTTLLPSLHDSFYRLPELGGIFTPNVLVFRNSLPLDDVKGELGVAERYYVDVVSAGMLRFPELEGGEDGEGRLGRKDREVVEAKMRAVLRIACQKGVRKVVLGAWGCGAYGNPVRDIAEAWCKVIHGEASTTTKRSKTVEEAEIWHGIEEIVFAITNAKMAWDFARAFGGGIEVEPNPNNREAEDEDDGEDSVAEELKTKIREIESQLEKVWNADLKQRMGVILEGLRAQLAVREGIGRTNDDEEEEEEEEEEEDEDEDEDEDEEDGSGDEESEHDPKPARDTALKSVAAEDEGEDDNDDISDNSDGIDISSDEGGFQLPSSR